MLSKYKNITKYLLIILVLFLALYYLPNINLSLEDIIKLILIVIIIIFIFDTFVFTEGMDNVPANNVMAYNDNMPINDSQLINNEDYTNNDINNNNMDNGTINYKDAPQLIQDSKYQYLNQQYKFVTPDDQPYCGKNRGQLGYEKIYSP
jgi:hypothetical protein